MNSFAAFELLKNEAGRKAFEEYFYSYQALADQYQLGFVMESPTWRANTDWGSQLGYTPDDLFGLNKQAIYFIQELTRPFSKSGNIGPRGDGYKADRRMTADQAMQHHLEQINAFAAAGADIVTAVTKTYTDEAIGIIQAAQSLPNRIKTTKPRRYLRDLLS